MGMCAVVISKVSSTTAQRSRCVQSCVQLWWDCAVVVRSCSRLLVRPLVKSVKR